MEGGAWLEQPGRLQSGFCETQMIDCPYDSNMYNRKVHTTFGTSSKHYLRKIGSK